jgi:hypothetical protein
MRRGGVFVGDVVKAVGALRANGEAAAEIARLLEIVPIARREEHEPSRVVSLDEEDVRVPERPRYEVPELSDAEAATFVPSRIERIDSTRSETAFSFDTNAELPPPTSEADEPLPPFEPLLRGRVTRAIVAHAVSTRVTAGVDVDRLVERIARRERIDPLPVRLVATVRRGVQLLLDSSSGMTLFRRDQVALAAWIRNVVGRERVTIASFTGTPLVRLLGRSRKRYSPPAPYTPVVLLTDLGIGRPALIDDSAMLDDWLTFGDMLRRARCPAIAFVPYPRDRWPRPLRRVFTIFEWDQGLTAARARRRR